MSTDNTEKILILRAMNRLKQSEDVPFTEKDIIKTRSIMIQGNYSASMSDCEVVRISGGCGKTCSVFQSCDCSTIEEGIENGSWTKKEAIEIGYDFNQ